MRPRKKLPMEVIVKEYREGMTSTELELKYGVSDTTIINRIREIDPKLIRAWRVSREE